MCISDNLKISFKRLKIEKLLQYKVPTWSTDLVLEIGTFAQNGFLQETEKTFFVQLKVVRKKS